MSTTLESASTSSPDATIASSNVAGDQLKCEWVGCQDRLPTPEKLYDHVCEKHVGRKSTNNLNLTCAWGNCRTTTVKRDHITSHIRVHVPLKPHKCDFCQKAFKRPQDLKKHVKTHAEDPNFQASPEPTRQNHPGNTGVFAGQSKHVADLQHLAATASGYYPEHAHAMSGAAVNYSYAASTNPSAYHGPSAQYSNNYMTTLYPVNNNNSMSEYEVRKKATFDALNEFFGDIKTRQLDPGVYHSVGQRLMGLHGLPQYAGNNEFGGGAAVATATAAPLTNHYSLPMSNIRTKNDLQHIDQFLEQLQATVYEHETQAAQAAQAGIQQAGSHYVHPAVNMRTSHSPPHMASSHQTQVSGHILPPISSSGADSTPALTPASSVMSYNSPGSVHSSTVSPISRGSSAAMYPTLPSVSSVSDASSGAMPSALASSFDADGRRRYSSGILQRARDDVSDDLPNIDRLGVRSPSLSNVDPALVTDSKAPTSPAGSESIDPDLSGPRRSSETSEPDSEDDWIVKVRVLETIRNMIKMRLDNGEFDDDDDSKTATPGDEQEQESEADKDARSLYPVLRAVQED
ncbi:hypothetical protein BT63DRAFT_460365 [Microthyrium microscopicum]|uniref:C2H2-type domain-containing protein n=1 Tax=Microthyrium microscopicum TaxID=703497 RepID=A0A6A6TZH3_9PEZI|nr:hypothetical protein BT63DRAFT_460365 [Microthyrium microscopicum]